MATEALGSMFDGFVAQLGPGLPDFLCFVTGSTSWSRSGGAGELKAAARSGGRSRPAAAEPPGAVHVLLPTCKSLAPETLLGLYEGWTVEEDPKRRRRSGTARECARDPAHEPACPADTM